MQRLLTDLGIDALVLVMLALVALFAAPMLYGFWRGRRASMIESVPSGVRHELLVGATVVMGVAWILIGAYDDGLPGAAAGALTLIALVAVGIAVSRRSRLRHAHEGPVEGERKNAPRTDTLISRRGLAVLTIALVPAITSAVAVWALVGDHLALGVVLLAALVLLPLAGIPLSLRRTRQRERAARANRVRRDD